MLLLKQLHNKKLLNILLNKCYLTNIRYSTEISVYFAGNYKQDSLSNTDVEDYLGRVSGSKIQGVCVGVNICECDGKPVSLSEKVV